MHAPLSILVIHRMGDPRLWRTAVRASELLLPETAQGHRYVVHPSELPLPTYVRDLRFHGIVLGPTFLCARQNSRVFERLLQEYDFVKTADAFKIALPQDDYDCHAVLDRWMVDWKVDVVYSACPRPWDVLYPAYSASGRIEAAYTGYIPPSWIERWQAPQPSEARAVDVSYRAAKLPPNFGRVGYLKGVIGDRFRAHPATAGLRLDISTVPGDLIPGQRWHSFMESARFCLATPSGSSLLDPVGGIRQCVEAFLIKHPDASFSEVEAHCFPGQDGRHEFTAIAPRHMEAALARTVQIATSGDYSGLLEAGRHYVALEPDCANAADVVRFMKDAAAGEAIADRAKEAVLSVDALRAVNRAAHLIDEVARGASAKRVQASPLEQVDRVIERHRMDIDRQAERHWRRRRHIERLHGAAVALGARKLKRLVQAAIR